MIAPTITISYTTDPASDTTPAWTTVLAANVRSFSTSRGRDDVLGRVEAGTATIVLNNRTRLYDPQVVTGLKPMNRWRIQAVYNAVTYDIFLGYAESYEQQWPATAGRDATTTVHLVDEMKVLAMARLPAMDPPVDTYADVVLSDKPQGYWKMESSTNGILVDAVSGGVDLAHYGGGTMTLITPPIVGDWNPPASNTGLLARSTTTYFATVNPSTQLPGLEYRGPGDADGLSSFSFETWFKSSEATPASARVIAAGPDSGGAGVVQWGLALSTTGKIIASARNSGGSLFQATSAQSIAANTWYHLAMSTTGSQTALWINGVLDPASPASYSGSFGVMDAGGFMYLGNTTAVGGTRSYDEPAFYRYAVPTARWLAHYQAGALRGLVAQDPGARVTSILAASTSIAATSVRAGSREVVPVFYHGQSPLDEIRQAEVAENVQAVFFIGKSGTSTFLDDNHRLVSPWNAIQATFDDDGTDLPYSDLSVDYSELYLYNTIRATRVGGNTVTDSDATSISEYRERPLELSTLPLTTDSDVSYIASALKGKYKDAMERVTGITVELKTTALIAAILSLEIGYPVAVNRTKPGGGSRALYTAYVQKIQVNATPFRPWQVRLSLSQL